MWTTLPEALEDRKSRKEAGRSAVPCSAAAQVAAIDVPFRPVGAEGRCRASRPVRGLVNSERQQELPLAHTPPKTRLPRRRPFVDFERANIENDDFVTNACQEPSKVIDFIILSKYIPHAKPLKRPLWKCGPCANIGAHIIIMVDFSTLQNLNKP
ncbi:hypothetical protein JRQ81_000799 [Phrynocephalus forsythii]|uniref:Uncharacterized protein n=1 Tax=Phrynocephalus forsythii TaxID=171643 RepID=A0A9Q1B8E2_9SAUR|nr:hypothetical protein JRQ81_000799 [Phrynocephalus forsythii]